MTQEELSAQEVAIDKAIGFATAAEALDAFDGDIYALTDASNAWATIALAVTEHNKSVVTVMLAEAASKFVDSPDPDAYARLAAAAESYREEN